jgi:hypothetical protein
MEAFGFSKGTVSVLNTSQIMSHINIGLRGVSIENFHQSSRIQTVGELVFSFDEFCGIVDEGLEHYIDP